MIDKFILTLICKVESESSQLIGFKRLNLIYTVKVSFWKCYLIHLNFDQFWFILNSMSLSLISKLTKNELLSTKLRKKTH
jgi:hypothetical protein